MLVPTAWQALADPGGETPWPDRAQTWADEIPPFAAALEILVFATGWPRLDLGVERWRESGYQPLSPVLSMIIEILGDRLDELAGWLVASSYAAGLEQSVGEAVGCPVSRRGRDTPDWISDVERLVEANAVMSPFGPGLDEMHLAAHADGPLNTYRAGGDLLVSTLRPHHGVLILEQYAGWYTHLAQQGAAMPATTDGRSWRITVVCEHVGSLGTYRRSRVSGRWFRDGHAVHALGIE